MDPEQERPSASEGVSERRPRELLVLLLLLALVVAGSTVVRARTAFSDPNFDVTDAKGMLKSDPALLAYIVERVRSADGLLPDDFRADPRVEHPDEVDLAAQFTVGQELLVANAYDLYEERGGTAPLHVFATWLMGLTAALAAVGVFGLTWELTRSSRWALVAALAWSVLPANYRTIGFVLIREDLSLPLFALHLWPLARAARTGSIPSYLAAGLLLLTALATWHAMSFLVALEVGVLLLWFLVTGQNALAARRAWIPVAVVGLGSLGVPALRATLAPLSAPMQLALALLAGASLGRTRRARTGVVVATWAALAGAAVGVSKLVGGGLGEYRHVYEVWWAKLTRLGVKPEDPNELSFDARLLWQGPFNGLDAAEAWRAGGWVLVLAVPAVLLLRSSDRRLAATVLFALVTLPVAWLMQRTVVVTGLLLPVVAVCAWAHRGVLGRVAVAVVLVLQSIAFSGYTRSFESPWYAHAWHARELAAAVDWVAANVPEGEAVVTDFVLGPALLLHTGRPIALQPKYETAESRARARELFEAYFHGTPEELRRLCLERFESRWLVIDRFTLWNVSRYTGGVPWSQRVPTFGTPAAATALRDSPVESMPGFELVYRTSPELLHPQGFPSDAVRIYRLEE